MPRKLFILCDKEDKDHSLVKALYYYASERGVEVTFPDDFMKENFYKDMEASIERSDVFVLVPSCVDGACWSPHLCMYANALRKARFSPSPRMFALKTERRAIPSNMLEDVKFEWIDSESDFNLILEDYPIDINLEEYFKKTEQKASDPAAGEDLAKQAYIEQLEHELFAEMSLKKGHRLDEFRESIYGKLDEYRSHPDYSKQAITSPDVAKALAKQYLGHLKHKVFGVMFLNHDHHLIEFREMFYVPIKILSAALDCNAASCILVHNSPDGTTPPSFADRQVTLKTREELGFRGIHVLDHIIVGESCYSLAEDGLLPQHSTV